MTLAFASFRCVCVYLCNTHARTHARARTHTHTHTHTHSLTLTHKIKKPEDHAECHLYDALARGPRQESQVARYYYETEPGSAHCTQADLLASLICKQSLIWVNRATRTNCPGLEFAGQSSQP